MQFGRLRWATSKWTGGFSGGDWGRPPRKPPADAVFGARQASPNAVAAARPMIDVRSMVYLLRFDVQAVSLSHATRAWSCSPRYRRPGCTARRAAARDQARLRPWPLDRGRARKPLWRRAQPRSRPIGVCAPSLSCRARESSVASAAGDLQCGVQDRTRRGAGYGALPMSAILTDLLILPPLRSIVRSIVLPTPICSS